MPGNPLVDLLALLRLDRFLLGGRPTVTQGLGVLSISADTAMDSQTGGQPTDLMEAAGVSSLQIRMPGYHGLRKDDRFILVPPPGFRFVTPAASVKVGGTSAFYDPAGEIDELRPIDGFRFINDAGELVWVAEEDPTEHHMASGDYFLVIGADPPLLIQPVTGVDASASRGQLELRGSALPPPVSAMVSGLGHLRLTPGELSTSVTNVQVTPLAIGADGDDTAAVTLFIGDQFANPMDRGGVAGTQAPALGEFAPAMTRLQQGVYSGGFRSATPGQVAIGATFPGFAIPGPTLAVEGVTLRLQMTPSTITPGVGAEVVLGLQVANDGAWPASGVEVDVTLSPDLSLVNALATAGGGGFTPLGDTLRWTGLGPIAPGGVATADVIVSIDRLGGAALTASARVVASAVHDANGAHAGAGAEALVELLVV